MLLQDTIYHRQSSNGLAQSARSKPTAFKAVGFEQFLNHETHEKHEIVFVFFVCFVVSFMFGQTWIQWTLGDFQSR